MCEIVDLSTPKEARIACANAIFVFENILVDSRKIGLVQTGDKSHGQVTMSEAPKETKEEYLQL